MLKWLASRAQTRAARLAGALERLGIDNPAPCEHTPSALLRRWWINLLALLGPRWALAWLRFFMRGTARRQIHLERELARYFGKQQ